MGAPQVSVVIPTYNRAGLLDRAIDSVLAQTHKNYEIIVVDDGSTDATDEILQSYEKVVTRLRQANRGVSAARNLGIEHSSGELEAFLDSDDEWLPDKLAYQVSLFDAANPCFICHTDEIWMREGVEVPQKGIHAKQGGRFFQRALERCLISPSSALLSRRLLDRVGRFDEDLPAAEDYDLWLRITAFHEVSFIPRPLLIKHGGHEDQLSRTTPAIDRYRIRAIAKILTNPDLPPEYRRAAICELKRKCRIVAAGCMKRGKTDEAHDYLELAESYENRSY
jgi:glycosyltransferase involved in cell wall biosynthesis